MATAIYVPRINNNDDEVSVLAYEVAIGDKVQKEQVVGQVETDKAALDVTAPCDGYVLGFVAEPDQTARVGSIMLWLGESAEEAVPQSASAGTPSSDSSASQITAKARLLLAQYGLKAEALQAVDGRITVEVVERYIATHGIRKNESQAGTGAAPLDALPEIGGRAVALTREEKGMAATVSWHHQFAVAGYIEIDYDLSPWAEFAKRIQDKEGLLMSPLLPLMAYRLVQVARETPRLNATVVGNQRFEYDQVNIGFTMQSGDALYMAVVRHADALDPVGFVNALGEILRRAAAKNLRESEASGATIGFSSMARWKVTRHVPILAPHTALMVAHAAGPEGRGTLGASYDHRVLNGGQVVSALKKLSSPE